MPAAPAFGVAVQRRQPHGGLVAERDRQGLLEMGAAGHRRVAIGLREAGEDRPQSLDIGFHEVERGADLQGVRRVHDVLGRRAPVDIAACLAGGGGQLVDERQDRIADDLRFVAKTIVVDLDGLGGLVDRLAGGRRNGTEPGLGARERGLGFEVSADEGLIGENRPHLLGAEHVAEQERIKNRACHSCLLLILSVQSFAL